MDVKVIRTEADHVAALRRIEALWGAPAGSPEGDELNILATLVERYEERIWPPHGKGRMAPRLEEFTHADLEAIREAEPPEASAQFDSELK